MKTDVVYETESDLIKNKIITVSGLKYDLFSPEALLLQWHITDRCNLRCIHCYLDKKYQSIELPLEQLKEIFEQYISFLKKFNIRGHINFTGGEPFIRGDFPDFLKYISAYKQYCSYGILTNGTIMTKEDVTLIKETGCRFVQISIEGSREIHDEIRGDGSYAKAIRMLKLLSRKRIFTYISFTAHRGNTDEFGSVVKAAKKTSADILWTDRLIPIGDGKNISAFLMNPEEVKNFFERSYQLRRKLRWNIFTRSAVSMHRALQFITLHEHGIQSKPYRCNAGRGLITVLSDGSLVPCRRMPIIIGNLLKQNLEDLYGNSLLFAQLRSDKSIPIECSGCRYKQSCGGGLKCLAYAYYGSPFRADPQCFLIHK